MLECITLAKMIQLVVQMLIDLAGSTVLDQKTTEDSQTTHPHNLTVEEQKSACFLFHESQSREIPPPEMAHLLDWKNIRWHSGISSTFPLSETTVSTNPSSCI